MNRKEIILVIDKVGGHLKNVMGALYGEDYAAGYKRAISDMIALFKKAPVAPDHETERRELTRQITLLKLEKDFLEAKNEILERKIKGLSL